MILLQFLILQGCEPALRLSCCLPLSSLSQPQCSFCRSILSAVQYPLLLMVKEQVTILKYGIRLWDNSIFAPRYSNYSEFSESFFIIEPVNSMSVIQKRGVFIQFEKAYLQSSVRKVHGFRKAAWRSRSTISVSRYFFDKT